MAMFPREEIPVETQQQQQESQYDNIVLSVFIVDTEQLFPKCIFMFKVNNGNTKTMCKICSKSTIKTPEQRQ